MYYEFKSIYIYGKDLESFQFHAFDKLIAVFKNSTNYNLSPENLFHIAMGILIKIKESFDKVVKMYQKIGPIISNNMPKL